MKTLFCDFDDVICENTFVDLINNFLNSNYKFEDLKEGYDCSEFVKDKKTLTELYKFVIENNFYNGAKLKPDCERVLKKLQSEYEIYILSACLVEGYEDFSNVIYKNKYDFIRKELPFINPKNLIFTNAKNVVFGDVMIDDRMMNLNGKFKTKLLFDCVYNKKYSDKQLESLDIKRVRNWKDIEQVLLKQ